MKALSMPNSVFDPRIGAQLSQTYFNALEAGIKAYEPAFKSVGRVNLELLGFVTRRSQAWLSIPARASQCKSPLDAINELLRFWQTFASDHMEGSHRLAVALGACAIVPQLNGVTQRDYITVREPDGAFSAAKRKDRKAA